MAEWYWARRVIPCIGYASKFSDKDRERAHEWGQMAGYDWLGHVLKIDLRAMDGLKKHNIDPRVMRWTEEAQERCGSPTWH